MQFSLHNTFNLQQVLQPSTFNCLPRFVVCMVDLPNSITSRAELTSIHRKLHKILPYPSAAIEVTGVKGKTSPYWNY